MLLFALRISFSTPSSSYLVNAPPLEISKRIHCAFDAPPACQTCGSRRVAELQLLPSLLSFLRLTVPCEAEAMSFGSAVVYSCEASCWDGAGSGAQGARSEFVHVQPEPDAVVGC